MDMNQLNIIGRMTRDPEAKQAGQTTICNFSIAVNGFKKDEVSFFNLTAFGKTGDFITKYLKKGSRVAVTGSIKQDTWEKDGQKQSRVSIIAQTVQGLDSKSDGQAPKQTQSNDAFSNTNFKEEDIPF